MNIVKEQDIHILLEVTKTAAIGQEILNMMLEQLKASCPPEFDVEAINRIMSEISLHEFVELLMPIYDSIYTHTEILELIKFYRSPVGQMITDKGPRAAKLAMEAGTKWGQEIAQKVIDKIQSEASNGIDDTLEDPSL